MIARVGSLQRGGIMTRVMVAESINNELNEKNLLAIRRLQQAGHQVVLIYYLPKVPAEFNMIPSVNSQLQAWRAHGMKKLEELGNKLQIPLNSRHFIDEVIGPDEVFREANQLGADIILTQDKHQLKQSFLNRGFTSIANLFRANATKELPVETVNHFVNKQLGISRIPKEQAVNDEKAVEQRARTAPLWKKPHKEEERIKYKFGKQEAGNKAHEEVTKKEKRYKR